MLWRNLMSCEGWEKSGLPQGHTHQIKKLGYSARISQMIGSSLPKTCHNNTKKQKCLSHTVWLGIVPAFFFFLNVCHTERKRASGWERTDSRTWAGQEGKLQSGVKKRVRRDRVQERGEWGRGKPFLEVQACSWSASRSSPLPSSCRALSLGLVSSTASEEENRGVEGERRRVSISSHMLRWQCDGFLLFILLHKRFQT